MAMIDNLRIQPQRLLKDLQDLAMFGRSQGNGVSRPAYSEAMQSAVEWLVGRMKNAGMKTRIDAVGNVIGRLGADDARTVICGSHIDSVPNGGQLDGTLGVMAAIECARVLGRQQAELPFAFEVIAFADEEGSYVSLLGSHAMMGNIRIEKVETARGRDGRTLTEAMNAAGLHVNEIALAARAPESIVAYLELHIEQGPILEDENIDIGVVIAINGVDAMEYRLTGQARHAGTTPLPVRKDAGRAASEAMASAYAQFEKTAVQGDRITFGSVEFLPGARNVVPASASVMSEVRSITRPGLTSLRRQLDQTIQLACEANGVTLEKRALDRDEPAMMDPRLMQTIERSCRKLGYSFKSMSSGAGHDAQAFAPYVPTAMIFIPSHDGISHHPAEYSDPRHIEAGANVLLVTVLDAMFSANPRFLSEDSQKLPQ
jgi:N-carbamoyl-L-amino-acid hydrolase